MKNLDARVVAAGAVLAMSLSAAPFRPEDIRRITVGYGGYYGREGEKVVFDVAAPSACMLTSGK